MSVEQLVDGIIGFFQAMKPDISTPEGQGILGAALAKKLGMPNADAFTKDDGKYRMLFGAVLKSIGMVAAGAPRAKGSDLESSFTPGAENVPLTNVIPEGETLTLAQCVEAQAARRGDKPAYWQRNLESKKFEATTWSDLAAQGRKVAAGLASIGLAKGDRICLAGPTHVSWAVGDLGGQYAGLVTVGIYQKLPVSAIEYIIGHCEAKAIVTDDANAAATKDIFEAVTKGKDIKVETIVLWHSAAVEGYRKDYPDIKVESLEGWISSNEPLSDDDWKARQGAPDDDAIFVYTSGTTGPPKGVQLSHKAINTQMTISVCGIVPTERTLIVGFLPYGHVAQRCILSYNQIAWGFTQAFATSPQTLLVDIQEVKPTMFGSVPRMFEKVYAGVQHKKSLLEGAQAAGFAFAEKVASDYATKLASNEEISFALKVKWTAADMMVFAKTRAALGGRVEYAISGAAPISQQILFFFFGIGIPVYEGYGMTEVAGLLTGNSPEGWRVGSVGKPCCPGSEVKIAEDGEILLRGDGVLTAYFKNPEATAETIIDGWVHSGDIGKMEDGFVFITDRKKHLIITAGGKNLSSGNIEQTLKASSPLISQVHAHGDKRAYISALVTPSGPETLGWALKAGVLTEVEKVKGYIMKLMVDGQFVDDDVLALLKTVTENPKYIEAIAAAIKTGNESLSHTEAVKRIRVLPRDFIPGTEVTPTLKVKRRIIETNYADIIAKIYDEDGFATNIQK